MRSLRYCLTSFINKLKELRSAWLHFARRQTFGKKLASQVTNTDVSIISSNCLGGVIAHDARLRFNSPTVNMWIPPRDFIELLKDLEGNLKSELKLTMTESGYPLGLLNERIHIHFIHFHSIQEVQDKWQTRLGRVRYDNVRVILTENDGCTYDDLTAFEAVPYKKVVFTHKPYPELPSAFYVKGFEKVGQVPFVMGWKGIFGARRCDGFDWVKFINSDN